MALASLSDVKAALGIAGTADDARLTLLIASAEAQIARMTGLRFSAGEVIEDHTGGRSTIALRARPALSITSVVDLASGAAIDETGYYLDTINGLLRRLPFGLAWDGVSLASPFLDPTGAGPGMAQPRWRVVFQAGYSTGPADLQGALFEMVASAAGSQGGKSSEKDGDYAVSYAAAPAGGIPASARAVIDSYRIAI